MSDRLNQLHGEGPVEAVDVRLVGTLRCDVRAAYQRRNGGVVSALDFERPPPAGTRARTAQRTVLHQKITKRTHALGAPVQGFEFKVQSFPKMRNEAILSSLPSHRRGKPAQFRMNPT